MGKMLLGLAVPIAALMMTSPAAAEETRAERFSAIGGAPQVGLILPGSGFHPDLISHGSQLGGSRHRRRGSSGGSDGGGVWINGGEWAHYNNQTFNSSSYNDWWHDSPRSQPAWVRNNQDCARPYFQGNVLRC